MININFHTLLFNAYIDNFKNLVKLNIISLEYFYNPNITNLIENLLIKFQDSSLYQFYVKMKNVNVENRNEIDK